MLTLDEVIKAFEQCKNDKCHECAYYEKVHANSCITKRNSDAIYYLKEYQTLQYGYIKAMADLEDNPPLTWDELQQMEGKPVWVEALLYKQWAVIAYVGSDHIRFEGANLYAPESRVYMGDANGWQAYRKERS